jgi:hypothetical protein
MNKNKGSTQLAITSYLISTRCKMKLAIDAIIFGVKIVFKELSGRFSTMILNLIKFTLHSKWMSLMIGI